MNNSYEEFSCFHLRQEAIICNIYDHIAPSDMCTTSGKTEKAVLKADVSFGKTSMGHTTGPELV